MSFMWQRMSAVRSNLTVGMTLQRICQECTANFHGSISISNTTERILCVLLLPGVKKRIRGMRRGCCKSKMIHLLLQQPLRVPDGFSDVAMI